MAADRYVVVGEMYCRLYYPRRQFQIYKTYTNNGVPLIARDTGKKCQVLGAEAYGTVTFVGGKGKRAIIAIAGILLLRARQMLLGGQPPGTRLFAQFGVHPGTNNAWKRSFVERAAEIFQGGAGRC